MSEPIGTVQIFISSPSDVLPERLIAQRVVDRLAREFAYQFRVEAFMWEREPLLATAHFQTLIRPPSQTDIVIVILWSRLGMLLPLDQFPGPLTGKPVTGTEWEFEEAYRSYQEHGRPELLMYCKTAPVGTKDLSDRERLEEQLRQQEAVKEFLGRWFINETSGTRKAARTSFKREEEFEERLETHLRSLLEQRVTLPASDAGLARIRWHQGSPYRGLASFELEHCPVFFGRRQATATLRRALTDQVARARAFVLVVGASGSGKSSLVKAGLLGDVRIPGMVPRAGLVRYGIARPSEYPGDPVRGLARACLKDTALPELAALDYDEVALTKLLSQAGASPLMPPFKQALTRAGETARLTAQAEARMLLIVDQLEELFTNEALTEAGRERYFSILQALVESGWVWVVATLRSDFFDRVSRYPSLAILVEGDGHYLVQPPTEAEIGQMIEQPAREAGLRFEIDPQTGASLAETLRSAARPEALPILEFTLEQLFQSRTEHGILTFAAYHALGGLEGAVGVRAERIVGALPEKAQLALPSVLRQLVTVGKEGVTARSVPASQFDEHSPPWVLVQALLAPDARLLSADGDDKEAKIRVVHEALYTHWQRARQIVEENRQDLELRAILEQEAARWEAGNRDAGYLRQGGKLLAEAQDLHERREAELDPKVRKYIRAGVQESERKTRRRTRILTVTTAIMFLLAIGAGIGAWFGFEGKREATQQAKAAVAQRNIAEAAEAQAERRRRLAEHNLGLALVEKADNARNEGRYLSAKLFALQGLRTLIPGRDSNVAAHAGSLVASALPYRPAFIARSATAPIAFSPDGRTVAAAGRERIEMWDVASGQRRGELQGHHNWVRALAFSPDGRTLASGGGSEVWLWDVATGQTLATFEAHTDSVQAVVFSPDSRTLASAGNDAIRLWDVAGRKPRATLKDDKTLIEAIAYSPDGRILASTGSNREASNGDVTIRLWDVASGQRRGELQGHHNWVRALAFSPDGRILAWGGGNNGITSRDDATIWLWDMYAGRPRAVLKGYTLSVRAIAFSPDGRTLASGDNGQLRLWDIASGRSQGVLEGFPHEVQAVAFAPDGRSLATATNDEIRVWEVAGTQPRAVLEGNKNKVDTIAFSPDGRTLASGGGDLEDRISGGDTTIRLWDVASGRLRMALRGHKGLVNKLAYSPDGRTLASASMDNTIRLWDVVSGQPRATLKDPVWSVAFSPDGRTLASVDGEEIRLWDVPTEQLRMVLKGGYPTLAIAFSPEGHTLASGFGKVIGLWDVADSQPRVVRMLDDDGVNEVRDIAFSPKGRSLVWAGSGGIRIWDVGSSQPRAVPQGDDGPECIEAIALSPDGRTLASETNRKGIRLQDVSSGQVLAILEGHTDDVKALAFSPDDRTLASASWDGTIRLWNPGFLREIEDPQEAISEFERQSGLQLNALDVRPIPESSLVDGGAPRKAVWSLNHPFHWLPRADHGDGQAMIQLGNIYLRDDAVAQARQWFERAREVPETRVEAGERLAVLRQIRGLGKQR